MEMKIVKNALIIGDLKKKGAQSWWLWAALSGFSPFPVAESSALATG
jgi:hypothetical protein